MFSCTSRVIFRACSGVTPALRNILLISVRTSSAISSVTLISVNIELFTGKHCSRPRGPAQLSSWYRWSLMTDQEAPLAYINFLACLSAVRDQRTHGTRPKDPLESKWGIMGSGQVEFPPSLAISVHVPPNPT